MRKARFKARFKARITPRVVLGSAGFLFTGFLVTGLLAFITLSMLWSEAEAVSPMGLERAESPPIATPIKTFRDCQEIARCTGCRPVYRCRSCKYQRVCRRGLCEWRDVCVWGPDVPVLPPNARIIRGPFRR